MGKHNKKSTRPTNARKESPVQNTEQQKNGTVKKVLGEQKELFIVIGGVVLALLSMALPSKLALIVQIGVAVVFVVAGALHYVKIDERNRKDEAVTQSEEPNQEEPRQ